MANSVRYYWLPKDIQKHYNITSIIKITTNNDGSRFVVTHHNGVQERIDIWMYTMKKWVKNGN